MNELIKLVLSFKQSKSDYVFQRIIHLLKGIVINKIKNINQTDKEDVQQTLYIGIYNTITEFIFNPDTTLNISAFTEENLKLLKEKEFSNANEIMNAPYLSSFIKKYGTDLLSEAFLDENKAKTFIDEFVLYSNENQLIGLIMLTFKYSLFDYNKILKKRDKYPTISLNALSDEDTEFIDLIGAEDPNLSSETIEKYNFEKKDADFLSAFIEGNDLLTEAEVGKKLGISQQAVHKRKMAIKKKYEDKIK